MSESVSIPLPCEMLVDQGRLIGNDPVGYKCSNSALMVTQGGYICHVLAGGYYLACESCHEKLIIEPQRISAPPYAGAATAEEAVERMRVLMQRTRDQSLDRAKSFSGIWSAYSQGYRWEPGAEPLANPLPLVRDPVLAEASKLMRERYEAKKAALPEFLKVGKASFCRDTLVREIVTEYLLSDMTLPQLMERLVMTFWEALNKTQSQLLEALQDQQPTYIIQK